MAEPQAETPEQIQSEISTLRTSPYGAGESGTDRAAKIEAAYKKLHPAEPDGTGNGTAKGKETDAEGKAEGNAEGAPEPTVIDWNDPQDAEIPPEVTEQRSAITSWMGKYGIDSENATRLVAMSREYFQKPLSDDEQQTAMMSGQARLRKEWGRDFARKNRDVNALMDAFEREFPFDDLQAAIAGGLWTDVRLVLFLGDLIDEKNVDGVDIDKVRKELAKTNQGSARYKELTTALDRYYQRVHGRG